jgi:archaellum component FlaC
MKNLAVIILVLLVAIGLLGWYQGWFTVTKKDGKVDLQVHSDKFKADRDSFTKDAGEKIKAMKDSIAGLSKKSEKLKGDEKERVQTEIHDLEKTHDKLEKQISDLSAAAEPRFESIKQDLTKQLENVDKKIAELTKKLG